jgi:hypothetical protein
MKYSWEVIPGIPQQEILSSTILFKIHIVKKDVWVLSSLAPSGLGNHVSE